MSVGPAASSLYVGLMSGTSMDGIDAALVRFGDHQCQVLATAASPYPPELRDELIAASRVPASCAADKIGQLDHWVGECFRDAALGLLQSADVDAKAVVAIGSHGQTLRHQPRAPRPFTLQIGDPNIIATGTGITTVADFRRRDIAVGGEGAPLAPAFHQWLFSAAGKHRAVLNIGGIANVTLLTPQAVFGFDTGPGNTLLDSWARDNLGEPYDDNGAWAGDGSVSDALLVRMLNDPYFSLPAPKSTGFEYFNGAWIQSALADAASTHLPPADVQATLSELTAKSVAEAILKYAASTEELFVCGGGVHNSDLMARIRSNVPGSKVMSTESLGLHPDWVEAAAFAWLAKRCLEGETGNLPQVTGAASAQVLGAIYLRTQ